MIIEIDNVLVSTDIFTEYFCCDLDACKGICCVEGDAGAPVTIDEIAGIEDAIDTVWDDLSATAQAVIDKQGVAYTCLACGQDSLLQAHQLCPLPHSRKKVVKRHGGPQL